MCQEQCAGMTKLDLCSRDEGYCNKLQELKHFR